MAIKQSKSFKVLEQATDGSGKGLVRASFSGDHAAAAAQGVADSLARAQPGTRFYVFEASSAVYENGNGELARRDYSQE
jgi:hypothetical protein